MLRRHFSPVRAFAAAGLFSSLILAPALARAGDPADPVPTADAVAETVKILDAKKAGDLSVDVRGHGQSMVKVAIKNTSTRRLNVVIPPGLVAASGAGQAGLGGGAAGGGGALQNMGLGAPGNAPGGFGQFGVNGGNAVGFRSVGVAADTKISSISVAPGKSAEFDMPAVCLNFGLPSPVAKDKLTLVDVDDFTRDPRVRKALRSVGSYGTSQGTAQAIMWNVCNGVSFGMMVSQGEKVVNRYEATLASRFVEALDASTSTDLVDPSYLTEARIFLTIVGEKGLEKDALRLASEAEGLRVLGLPVRIAVAKDLPKATSPALHLIVNLTESKVGSTTGKITVRHASGLGNDAQWIPLGKANFKESSAADALKGIDIARAVDHAVAVEFVSVRPVRKSLGSTGMRIDNHLPFSLSSVTLKATGSAGAPAVTFSGLGIGPVRSGLADLQASNGTIERVELNGL
jgi:hypothetical protein